MSSSKMRLEYCAAYCVEVPPPIPPPPPEFPPRRSSPPAAPWRLRRFRADLVAATPSVSTVRLNSQHRATASMKPSMSSTASLASVEAAPPMMDPRLPR